MPEIIVQCSDLDSIAERLGEALGVLIETIVERQIPSNTNYLQNQDTHDRI